MAKEIVRAVESSEEYGLLEHEIIFVKNALAIALSRQKEASLAVGEAVESSGGDWAFDDPGTQAAAQTAAREDDAVRKLTALIHVAGRVGTFDYPDADNPKVVPGSRITVGASDWDTVYDVVSRRIPGMPYDDAHDVTPVSAQSAMGLALLERTVGDTVSWIGANGREFTGSITNIDQSAQRLFYEALFKGHAVIEE